MYFHDFNQSHHKRNGILIGMFVVMVLFALNKQSQSSSGVFSTWRGEPQAQAAPALSGSAIQVDQIGQGSTLVAPPGTAADEPWGNPVVGGHVVMTQGYGMGSHAPAEVWGAVDLAVDGNGDGQADPDGSIGAPIRATMSGYVKITADSWPAGNHIWVIGDNYKTGYAHLLSFEVADGQYVERGTVIARLGSTGSSSGPHLDYQVWFNGVNQNPLDFHVLP